MRIRNILNALKMNAFNSDFRGYDPYDGLYLNAKFSLLLKKTKFTRLLLIHLNKHLFINLRPVFGIKRGANPKTIALFMSGLVKLNLVEEAESLKKILLHNEYNKSKKSSWGYYFPWQSRSSYFHADTPTIVATSFSANSLMDLYLINKDSRILHLVKSSIDFFLSELNIYENRNGLCFSYSPFDKGQVYNASALGLEVIARYLYLKGEKDFEKESILRKGISFIKAEQNKDGSWFYGKHLIQHFIDHYHTAYLLESLENIRKYTYDKYDLKPTIKKGINFYINNMFKNYRIPRFYKNAVYPIESHCSGAAIKALCVLSEFHGKELFDLAVKVAQWTIKNLYDEKKGYFYYQKRKFWTNKINYLRWSQAWMFVGLSYLLYYGKKYGYTFH
jgi:hypothetical protein